MMLCQRSSIGAPLLAALALLPAYAHPFDNPAEAQKARLEGTVSDAATGESLRKVTVELAPWSDSASTYRTTTDASGRFAFSAIPSGDYWLHGERAGYLQTSLGAGRSNTKGTILRLKADETLSDLHLKLIRASTISGKLIDDSGEPVARAWVTAYQSAWLRGHREYNASRGSSTNDAGEYRITGLPVGHYYIHASPGQDVYVDEQDKPEKRLLPAFYPGAETLNSAGLVEVPPGENLSGINLRLRTAETFHVRGKIATRPSGDSHPSVVAAREGLDPRKWQAGESEVERDGAFEIAGLPTGAYQLQVVSDQAGVYGSGSLPIEVKGGDLNGILIPLAADVKISGTIQFDGTPTRIVGDAISFAEADTELTSNTFGEVKENGTFQVSVAPGRYIISLPLPPDNDYVKSISYGGQDVLGQVVDLSQSASGQVEITVAKGAGRVDGIVSVQSPDDSSAAKEAARGAELALISDRARFDSAGAFTTQVDQTGHFSLIGVPPGKYYAFAAQDVETGLWQNRDFFAQVRGQGVEVNVAENGRVQIQLALLPASEVERALSVIGQ